MHWISYSKSWTCIYLNASLKLYFLLYYIIFINMFTLIVKKGEPIRRETSYQLVHLSRGYRPTFKLKAHDLFPTSTKNIDNILLILFVEFFCGVVPKASRCNSSLIGRNLYLFFQCYIKYSNEFIPSM